MNPTILNQYKKDWRKYALIILIPFLLYMLFVFFTDVMYRLNPDDAEHSRCIVCRDCLPHKIMSALGNDKWVCEECRVYPWEAIQWRLKHDNN